MDLESPTADSIVSIGIETCQALLACYNNLINHDQGVYRRFSKVARLRLTLINHCEMLRRMSNILSSPDPGSAEFVHRCLTDSIPGLIALSVILESIRDHNLQQDGQQEEAPGMPISAYPVRDDVVDALFSRLNDLDKILRPAQRYSKPLGDDVVFRRRQAFKALSEFPFDEEDPNDTNELTTFVPPGSVAQAQELAFAHNEVDNTEGTDFPNRVSLHIVGLDATDHAFVPAPRARRAIPTCYILAALGSIIIGGSLAVGIYYTVAKDRMGDGWTAASYMTGAGTLILAAPMAIHYSRCHCWESASDGISEPQPLAPHEERSV
jgi:hypothetical protein